MSDYSLLTHSVVMVRGEPISVPAPLPEGYSFRFFAPGMEGDWADIQCSVRRFPGREAADTAFQKEFSGRFALLRRRMLFVLDRAGRPVGTAALWPGDSLGSPMDQVCWVALIPGLQGRGIGKAMVAKLMDIARSDGCRGGIYLTAQSGSFPAISIFRQFGFEAYLGPCPRGFQTQGGSYKEESRSAWLLIDQKLAAYRGMFPSAEPAAAPAAPSPMFFRRDRMFSKISVCKIFEIAAPAQSGDVLHHHDYTQIWYVTRGCCEHYVEVQKYIMSMGDAFLLPPKVLHRTILRDGGAIICCEFYMESLLPNQPGSYDKLQEITQNISFTMLFQQELYSAQPKFSLSPRGQQETEKLLHSMLDEYTQEKPFFEDKLYLQILELLVTFAREYAMSPVREVSEKAYDKYRGMVEAAILYINEHYAEPISLDEICRISMVSKTYFCYLFKLLTHKTFVEYLTSLRLNRAMELLRQTSLSIIDISQTVGFRDSTHFSRTFKQAKGISPREYRRAARED